MAATKLQDPYKRLPEDIEEPPQSFIEIFKRIGPGLILASGIVGSGELIATTVLGAETGYILLWLILVSCAIKVVVQNELGRYAIVTGETTLEAFDRVPGPRLGVSWVVWMWAFMVMMTLMQVGGMLGAIGESVNRIVPAIPITAVVWVVNFATVGLLIAGRYALVERVAMGLVVTFTALTVSCAFVLTARPEFFSWVSVLEGLSFQLPENGLVTAVAVFGITGVGATELCIYPYWCLEKGYARSTGPRDDSPAWVGRARGWIRVLGVDVINSMVIYTVATIAFYLLGAGILHGMGMVPEGTEMVAMLSNMYTRTLGPWSWYLFMAGAIAVFYSTVFAATAGHSRLFADFTGMLGIYDKQDYSQRLRMTRIWVVILLFLPSVYYMVFEEPVIMVKIGGVAQAVMLPIIGFVTVYLSHRHMPPLVLPKGWVRLTLWATSAIMAFMMGYSVILRLSP